MGESHQLCVATWLQPCIDTLLSLLYPVLLQSLLRVGLVLRLLHASLHCGRGHKRDLLWQSCPQLLLGAMNVGCRLLAKVSCQWLLGVSIVRSRLLWEGCRMGLLCADNVCCLLCDWHVSIPQGLQPECHGSTHCSSLPPVELTLPGCLLCCKLGLTLSLLTSPLCCGLLFLHLLHTSLLCLDLPSVGLRLCCLLLKLTIQLFDGLLHISLKLCVGLQLCVIHNLHVIPELRVCCKPCVSLKLSLLCVRQTLVQLCGCLGLEQLPCGLGQWPVGLGLLQSSRSASRGPVVLLLCPGPVLHLLCGDVHLRV
jgi:hypothetical protein